MLAPLQVNEENLAAYLSDLSYTAREAASTNDKRVKDNCIELLARQTRTLHLLHLCSEPQKPHTLAAWFCWCWAKAVRLWYSPARQGRLPS